MWGIPLVVRVSECIHQLAGEEVMMMEVHIMMRTMMVLRQEVQQPSSFISSPSSIVMTIIWMLWWPGSVDPPTSGPSAPNDSKLTLTHRSLQRRSSTSIDQSQLRDEEEEEKEVLLGSTVWWQLVPAANAKVLSWTFCLGRWSKTGTGDSSVAGRRRSAGDPQSLQETRTQTLLTGSSPWLHADVTVQTAATNRDQDQIKTSGPSPRPAPVKRPLSPSPDPEEVF